MRNRIGPAPHYFYPTDKGWKFNGPLETDEATIGTGLHRHRFASTHSKADVRTN
ncbi:MAG: hypothetical protein WBZ19_27610 [Chthoniobacterales bacterium]